MGHGPLIPGGCKRSSSSSPKIQGHESLPSDLHSQLPDISFLFSLAASQPGNASCPSQEQAKALSMQRKPASAPVNPPKYGSCKFKVCISQWPQSLSSKHPKQCHQPVISSNLLTCLGSRLLQMQYPRPQRLQITVPITTQRGTSPMHTRTRCIMHEI